MLDILSKAGLLGCRASDTLIETNVKLLPDQERTWIILVDIEDWLKN